MAFNFGTFSLRMSMLFVSVILVANRKYVTLYVSQMTTPRINNRSNPYQTSLFACTVITYPAALFMMREDTFLRGIPDEFRADFIDGQEVASLKLQVLKDRIRQRFPVSVALLLFLPRSAMCRKLLIPMFPETDQLGNLS